jgi:transitional endoplasmic reticulum ATPase
MEADMNGDDTIQSLREALGATPQNIPLRLHLAETLISFGRADEAEQEVKRGISQKPNDDRLKLALAGAYAAQAKNGHALVILEELDASPGAPAKARLLLARVLLREGEIPRAARAYRRAVEADSALADAALARQLGIDAAPTPAEEPESTFAGPDERLRAAADDQPDDSSAFLEKPSVNFKDVGGMDALKEEIRLKIIHPLNHPELYKAYGKNIGGGILLYGPPGCGKTHLARATAGEVNAGFIAIGISDVLDMWIGASEKNLHQIFETARRNTPCVLFFDEVDALGASRTDMKRSAGRQLINQFLSELDGVKSSNEGVLILAATNAPWHMDPAFRRPGRFDRILFVPPPDQTARAGILRVLLRGKPTKDLDHEAVAAKTDGFSGADLKGLVDLAIEAKLRDAVVSGTPTPLATKDLLAAIKSARPTTTEWFGTAKNYAVYANQGGLYDDVLKHMRLK